MPACLYNGFIWFYFADETDVNELLQKNIRIQKQSSYKAQAIRQKIPNQEAAEDEG